jgi:monofunctional biosynthetic peptidoglycan transglycosylase
MASPSPVLARIGRLAVIVLVLAGLLLAGAGLLWVSLPDPSPLARENPRTTALIEQRKAEAKAKGRRLAVRQAWVPAERLPRRLVDVVLLAEDARFNAHAGIDWAAMKEAARHDLAAGSFARGASTITQQLAKNLWLGTEKSLWRKAKEAILAAKLERALAKRRILALYLGVAEWGDGVFGAEAGARARFGVPAERLTTAQAVVMAAMLPAPRRADLSHPSTWLRARARRLLDRLRDEGGLPNAEHLEASAELERILGGARPADDTGSEEPPAEAEATGNAAPGPAPLPGEAGVKTDDAAAAPAPADSAVPPEPVDGPAHPVLEPDARRPAEDLARP